MKAGNLVKQQLINAKGHNQYIIPLDQLFEKKYYPRELIRDPFWRFNYRIFDSIFRNYFLRVYGRFL